MDYFDNQTVDELIDHLVWHICAGSCSCKECLEIKGILQRRQEKPNENDSSSFH